LPKYRQLLLVWIKFGELQGLERLGHLPFAVAAQHDNSQQHADEAANRNGVAKTC